MRKALLYIFVTLFVVLNASSQGKYPFSDDPIQFIKDVHKKVTQKDKEKYSDIADVFREAWRRDSLTAEDKAHFIKLTKACVDQKLPPIPYWTNNMELLYLIRTTTDINQNDMNEFMETTEKVIRNHSRYEMNNYYQILITFFEHDALYKTNNSSFYSSNGSMQIKYIEEAEEEEIVIPDVPEEPEEETKEDEADFGDWDEEGEVDDWGTIDEEESWGSEDDFSDEPESLEENQAVNEEALAIGYSAPELPTIKGPVFEFANADMTLISRFDSIVIHETSGTLLLGSGQFVGKGGRVDWTSAGLDSTVYAELPDYLFDIKKTSLDAEGAKMYYPAKIDGPIEGIFEYRSVKHDTTTDATYPRFMSYKSNINLKDLGDDIKYWGGFSLNGHKVYSSSVSGGACKIEVYHESVKKLRARAKFFVIDDSIITARNVGVGVYFDEDSLFHGGVQLKYNLSSKKLMLFKERSGFKNSPFLDSYHRYEILIDALYYTMGDSVLAMTMRSAKNEAPAYFTSEENYQLKKYAQLKGIYPFHSLQLAVYYANKKETNGFYIDDLDKAFKSVSYKNLESSMHGLMLYGYIDYNPKTGYVLLKDKAFHYVESHKLEKDYDNIEFRSINPKKYNAYIDLKSHDMTVYGVEVIPISDSLDVNFYPDSGKVILHKNRSFTFNGKVVANNYNFMGREFYFDYENYNVDLVHIDSLKFEVDVIDTLTGKVIGKKELDNKLNYSSGLLTIDLPDNKATRELDPKYPHFDAVAGAYIYFSSKEVLNGAYDSSVYFKIPPFDMDSLGGELDVLNFEGEFNTPMFPTFKESMVVMPDHSFGFVHDTPEEGYQLYNGKGVFFGTIKLDAGGLRGNGRIEFLNTTLESDDFVFYTDSIHAIGTRCNTVPGGHPDVAEEYTFPRQYVETYDLKWNVGKDSLNIIALEKPIQLFRDSLDFLGAITVTTHHGMKGNGLLNVDLARTVSSDYQFTEHGYISRESVFAVRGDDESGQNAFQAEMVKVSLDQNTQETIIQPEADSLSKITFPALFYNTSISKALWKMEEGKVFMSSTDTNTYFHSFHPSMDSLVFTATKATYNIDSVYLHIEEIPYIKVADSRIIPDKGEVFVRENSEIDSLLNCKLQMDTLNFYHSMYDGRIKIQSGKAFNGIATYQYVNASDDTLDIFFDNFEFKEFQVSKKETELHTQTTTNIFPEDSLHLSRHVLYKGPVVLNAHERNLNLDGWVLLDLHGSVHVNKWLKNLVSQGEHEIIIDLDHQEDTLFNGLSMNKNFVLSSKFLEKAPKAESQIIFEAHGAIYYNKENEEFEVTSFEYLNEGKMDESLFAYSDIDDEFRFQGPFNLLNPMYEKDGQVSFSYAGTGSYALDTNMYDLTGIGILNYDMPSKAFDEMGQNLADVSLMMGQMGSSMAVNDTLYREVAFLAGEKAGKAYASMGGYVPFSQVHKNFKSGIVFSRLELRWNPFTKSWYSIGKIGISNINEVEVNAEFKGYFELKKTKKGDEVTLFLEMNEYNWYFLQFKDNVLSVATTNNTMATMVDDKSQAEKNSYSGAYYFANVSPMVKNKFLNYYSQTYLSGEPLFEITEETLQEEADLYEDENIEIEDEYYSEEEEDIYSDESEDDLYEEEETVQEETAPEEQNEEVEEEAVQEEPKQEEQAEEISEEEPQEEPKTEEEPIQENKVEEETSDETAQEETEDYEDDLDLQDEEVKQEAKEDSKEKKKEKKKKDKKQKANEEETSNLDE